MKNQLADEKHSTFPHANAVSKTVRLYVTWFGPPHNSGGVAYGHVLVLVGELAGKLEGEWERERLSPWQKWQCNQCLVGWS
jgi:hypothetical protein